MMIENLEEGCDDDIQAVVVHEDINQYWSASRFA